MQSFYDGMALVGSLVVMVAVIALAYYGSRWYAGRMRKTASTGNIKVIEKLSLSPGTALLIVQAGERYYLVGLGDKSIRLLCELEDFVPEPVDPGQQVDFNRLFRGVMDKLGGPKDDGNEK